MAISLFLPPRLTAAVDENRADIIEVVSLCALLPGDIDGPADSIAAPFALQRI